MARQAMPVQAGKVIDYINSGETKINVGDVVPLISLCGIAETDIEAGASGAVALYGVWEFTAETSVAFEVGDIVYWDAANNHVTKTAAGGVFLGIVVAPKAASAALARCKIGVAAVSSSASA